MQKKVAFYTLGCKLNFSETSTIARRFTENGYERVHIKECADVYVINSCTVTASAEKKCRQAITKFKKQNENAVIAIVGCYSQLRAKELAEIEAVDIVLGSKEKYNILQFINDFEKQKQKQVYSCEILKEDTFSPAYSSADRTRSFLKVQDGCDYFCTYCTIPFARGKSRNAPISKILEQAAELVSEGIKEVVITGVNTGDFGKSTGENFPDLLRSLEKVEGLERIRLSSIEPNLITDEIIEHVKHSEKILPHYHIPLQSGSNEVLKRMKRKYDTQLFEERIKLIKQRIPDAFIGVDVIVGFPGETDELFEETYSFLEKLSISFIHVFSYSVRPGTKASGFEGKIPKNTIDKRSKKLHDLAEIKLHSFYKDNLGKEKVVLFEKQEQGGKMFGFTDNYIKVETDYNAELAGEIVSVTLKELLPSSNVKIIINSHEL